MMKTTSRYLFEGLLALTVVVGLYFGTATVVNAEPHPGAWDARHHYYRDNYGYWDEHDHYRHYTDWHHHHGYWDNRGGVRVFINVD